LALLAGVPLGLVAGYAEGALDQLIMRPLDVLMSFPALLLAIALMSVFGTGVVLVAASLAVVYTPIVARVVRAAVLAVKVEVYVDGARALGAPVPRLVLRHILPNAATPVLVQASVLMAIAILVEAALSFLGVGVRPPTPSLGLMLADGRGFMLQAPWMVIFPGLAIMAAVLGFNMVADGLRDWLDPHQAARRYKTRPPPPQGGGPLIKAARTLCGRRPQGGNLQAAGAYPPLAKPLIVEAGDLD